MPRADADALVAALSGDAASAAIGDRDRVMLDYAMKLTASPAAVDRVDIQRLRSAGFDDRAIHDVCAIAAYFAFVNRIADGLGVELESEPE